MDKSTFDIDVTVILNDGKLFRSSQKHGAARGEWSRSMFYVGSQLIAEGIKIEDVSKVVVIASTDVFVYEGSEPAEILGL